MTEEMSREVRERIIGRAPLGRLAQVEEVARVIAFLLSAQASAITGQTIAVDCGLSAV
jgi:3-oxoacyl-[acyl-carrier protein] reductase